MAALIVEAVKALTEEVRALRDELREQYAPLGARLDLLEDILETADPGPEEPADLGEALGVGEKAEPVGDLGLVEGELDVVTGKPARAGRK